MLGVFRAAAWLAGGVIGVQFFREAAGPIKWIALAVLAFVAAKALKVL